MKIVKTAMFIWLAIILGCSPQNNASKTIESQTLFTQQKNIENMKLGAFSISLNVKDIHASKLFYESFGFQVLGGDIEKNYLIMKNEHALIGLFQGMFENNILTFNPGWDENGKNIGSFDDVRVIQKHLLEKGIKLDSEADANTSGPASIIVQDPDGNMIFIDQHR